MNIILVCLIFSFVFIRIYHAHTIFMLPSVGDDGGYFAWIEAWSSSTFNWCAMKTANVDISAACERGLLPYNRYSPGPAILWLPFALMGKIFAPYVTGGLNPLLFFTVVGTFFLFLCGALLMHDTSRQILKNKVDAFWCTLFFLCGNVVLYYVFRRPLMSHAAEFFLFFLIAWMITKNASLFWIGLAAGLIFITRLNGFYLLFLAAIIPLQRALKNKSVLSSAFLYAAGAMIPILFFFYTNFLQTGSWIYRPSSYDEASSLKVLFLSSPRNLERIPGFFWGPHWGAYLLMPFMAFEALFFCLYTKKICQAIRKNIFLSATSAFLILLYLVMMANFPSNGMSYGARYLLGVYYLHHLGFIFVLGKYGFPPVLKKIFIPVGVFCCVIASFQLINFESNSDTLTLTNHKLSEEGIIDPNWKDRVMLTGPNYAVHSLKKTLTGSALVNLAVSPLAAYPLMAMRSQLHATPAAKAYEYYESSKRQILGFSDLAILYCYHIWIALFALLLVSFPKIYRLLKSYNNHQHGDSLSK